MLRGVNAGVVALLGLALACGTPRSTRFGDDGLPLVEMAPALAAQEALAPILAGPPERVDLELAFPENGTIFSETPDAYLAGRIEAPLGVPGASDAMVVIDTSLSTSRKAARGPGRSTRKRTPGADPDTVLDAELASVHMLLEEVDLGPTRLGIVSFAGAGQGAEAEFPEPARTEVHLTQSREALERSLQRIAARGSAGGTDMAAGLDRAVDELLGRGRSRPRPHDEAQQVIIFFTDGTPTLPFGDADANEMEVIAAARRAAVYGIRVFSFAVGPEALGRPVAAVEMARRTGGVFTPVKDPRDLTAAVRTLRLARFDALEIQNLTSHANARKLHLGPGGTFNALVPLQPGKNRIHVRARFGDVWAEAERSVHYAPGHARPFVPAELEARRLDLVSAQRQLEVGIAREQGKLVEVFVRDRREAEARAARQLKELELSIDVAAPPPVD